MAFNVNPKTVAVELLPVAPILVPVFLHFVLVSFVLLSSIFWLPFTYFFSHLILIAVGFWACHAKKEILPAVVFVGLVLVTILMDIIQLGLYFPGANTDNGSGRNTTERTWQFSAGMCIMNLLLKPVTIALACVAVYVRAGGKIGGLGGREEYSDIHGTESESGSQQQNN